MRTRQHPKLLEPGLMKGKGKGKESLGPKFKQIGIKVRPVKPLSKQERP